MTGAKDRLSAARLIRAGFEVEDSRPDGTMVLRAPGFTAPEEKELVKLVLRTPAVVAASPTR
jgi:hypothetical protein